MAKKSKIVGRIRLYATVLGVNDSRTSADLELYLPRGAKKMPEYLWRIRVPVSELPEHVISDGAECICVVREYANGKADYVFEYPKINVDGLRKLLEKYEFP
jgi:hypothetical protein